MEISAETVGITNDAFQSRSNLKNITFPDSIRTIGNYAFYDCTALTNVNLSEGLKEIRWCAFENCTQLKNIVIPSSVTAIKGSSFSECKNLETLTIPEHVTTIEAGAFRGCVGLASMVLPDSVKRIGNRVFANCTNLTTVRLPANITCFQIGIFENCINLNNIIIPDSVTSLEESSFKNCTSLTTIHIPDHVTSIGSSCFQDCTNLTEIETSDSIAYIGKNAFQGTPFLNNQTTAIKYAGKWAIDCDETATQIEILPDTVGIAGCTFENCTAFSSVIIPDSVTYVAMGAFNNCIRLEDVYYNGSRSQWKKVKINMDLSHGIYSIENKYLINANIHFKIYEEATGDVNADSSFTIADIVAFQKWLLNMDTLTDWKEGDFDDNNVLNVIDLCLMKSKE